MAVVRGARAAWRRLAPFLGASRGQLAVLAGASVAAGLIEAALLSLIASVGAALSEGADRVDTSFGPLPVQASITAVLVVGVVLALVRAGVQLWLAYLPASMSARAAATLRQRLFDAFTGTSWSVQASERDGHFQSLMSTHVASASQAVINVGQGISAGLMFATMLATAFVLSVPTALVLVATSTVLLVVLAPLSRRLRRHAAVLSAENVEYSKGVQEIVLMAEERQVFGASPTYRAGVHALIEAVRRPLVRVRYLSHAVPSLYQSVAFLLLVLALGAVARLPTAGITALGAVVLILIRSLTYGRQLQSALSKLDELLPFMHRLRDAIDHYSANPQQDGDQPMPAVVGSIGMSAVSFGYVDGEDVLSDITFEVRKGEAVGIVGPSGAGKSSLVQLLLRLRDPRSGVLHVDGHDARDVRRADWQRRVAYVPQTPQLIWGTVADNIRFDRPDISDADVERAARQAHVHDEIVSWPEGYQTVVGQRASAVSGGQRQRLCLARALAGGPDVLILDEPTSELDVRSEQLVQDSLHQLKGRVALFLVAHRLSTLSVCDRVMVVVDGRLQAIDEPAALRDSNAFFREVTEITRQQSLL